ncbi:MAG TPA: hypothetical protein VK845_16290 [Gemmatimonadales bacterium]|nr:hypothetical protein [Gemmatimonadales bacterium]
MTTPTEKPTTTKSSSRRAVLAGALGGIGAWAASAIGRASPVRAEGENIQVGGEYTTATSRTYLENSANNSDVLVAASTGYGTGVYGRSKNIGVEGTTTADSPAGIGVYGSNAGDNPGIGVWGTSAHGNGVVGQSSSLSDMAGVVGISGGTSTGVLGTSGGSVAAKPKTGVYGYANQDAGSRGVFGRSPKGHGLHGETGNGAAVFGKANQYGHALRTRGRIKAEQVSGVATIPAGSTGVTVSPPVNVTSGSFVLLTPKANIGSRGLWFTTNASADTFRIRMSSSRSSNTKVAWLLLG